MPELERVYRHDFRIRIVKITLFDLVVFLRQLLSFIRVKHTSGLMTLLQRSLHVFLQLQAELGTERQELGALHQIKAVNLVDEGDVHHRISQFLTNAKNVHLPFASAILCRFWLRHCQHGYSQQHHRQ